MEGQKQKKILFTGGGSAGHITLNLSLIPLFKEKEWDISYIDSKDGIEKDLISKVDGVKYYPIQTGKLRCYFSGIGVIRVLIFSLFALISFGAEVAVGPIVVVDDVVNGTDFVEAVVTERTITVDGKDYKYTTLKKIDSGEPWVEVDGGVNGYEHYEEFTNPSGASSANPVSSVGGAIVNKGNIQINSVVFTNNKVETKIIRETGGPDGTYYGQVRGGAIYNEGTIDGTNGNLVADFIGNSAEGSYSNYNTSSNPLVNAYGGAIYNSSANAKIGNIYGDFIGNYASSSYVYGGAIYNPTIGNIYGDFIGNYAKTSATTIY